MISKTQLNLILSWIYNESTELSIKFHKMLASISKKWMDEVNDNYAVPSPVTIKQTIERVARELEEFWYNEGRKNDVFRGSRDGILITFGGNDSGHFIDVSLVESKRAKWGRDIEEEEEEPEWQTT